MAPLRFKRQHHRWLLRWKSLAFFLLLPCISSAQNGTFCEDLQTLLPSDQVICDTGSYKFDFGNPYCNQFGSSVAAVVRPFTTEEAAAIVKYVYDNRNTTTLSIRSGGHSYSCNGVIPISIHIDLRNLDSAELVDNNIDSNPHPKETKLLKFGTGNTFERLLKVASPKRYTFVHGECHSVGVGGFYLHGGAHLTAITNLYGIANESIRELEMITADGSVLRFIEARNRTNGNAVPPKYDRAPVQVWKDGAEVLNGAELYQDLWTAVRKAGSSFGLVTSITAQVWKGREPMTWVFLLRRFSVKDKQLIDLFMETAETDDVSLSLATNSVSKNGILVSLKNGSRFPLLNRIQCIRYLAKWFRRRQLNLFWRLSKFRGALSLFAGILYRPGSDFADGYASSYISWSVLLSLQNEDARDTLQLFRDLTDSRQRRKDCFMIVAHVNFRHQPLQDNFLATEVNCGPRDKWETIQRDLERETKLRAPDYFKYRNVPIDMGNEEEDEELVVRYHPNELEMLREFKTRYDPYDVFSVFQGIVPL